METKSGNKTTEQSKTWFCVPARPCDCHIGSHFDTFFCTEDKLLPTDCAPDLSENKIYQANKGLLRGSCPAAPQAFSRWLQWDLEPKHKHRTAMVRAPETPQTSVKMQMFNTSQCQILSEPKKAFSEAAFSFKYSEMQLELI